MNVFGHLKKIFNSFDFMGNRIKRLRVDTPENFIDDNHPTQEANPIYREDINKIKTPDQISAEMKRGSGTKYNEVDYERYKDFVANKNYVDKSVDYNTEVARNQELGTKATNTTTPSEIDLMDGKQGSQSQQRTPSQFPWVGKIFGLTVKEVLDKLLYPRIQYTYKFPKLIDIKIKTDNYLIECLEQNASTNKFLLNEGVQNKLFFDILIDNGDWINTEKAEIRFYSGNQLKLNITGNYIKNGPTHIVANYDDISISVFPENIDRVELHQTYKSFIQHYDTWGYPSQPVLETNPNIKISSHELVVDITEEFLKQCYVWNIKQKVGSNYNFINQLTIQQNFDNHNNIELKIPTNIANDYYLEYYIYDTSYKLLNTGYISQKEINSDGTINYNFGTYYENIYIKFKPIPVTSVIKFVQND